MKCLLAGVCFAFVLIRAAGTSYENPDVPDVPAAFARIDEQGVPFGINSGIISYPGYSLNPYHTYKADHFQGVQRLHGGKFLVIAASTLGRDGPLPDAPPADASRWRDPHGMRGQIFIAQLKSRPVSGPWKSNLDPATHRPVSEDSVEALVEVELKTPGGTGLWHAGGFTACGDILVVPVENYLPQVGEIASQIFFFDLSDPLQPRQLNERIYRDRDPFKAKGGAASMIRLPEGKFLLATRDTSHLSFYFSRTDKFTDGFEPQPRFVIDEGKVEAVSPLEVRNFGGQAFHFVRQKDGQIFAISSRGTRENGKPRQAIWLWRFDFPKRDYSRPPTITRLAEKEMGPKLLGTRGWGDFEAAPGLFVTEKGELAFYVAARWMTREVSGDLQATPTEADAVSPDDRLFIPAVEFWPSAGEPVTTR